VPRAKKTSKSKALARRSTFETSREENISDDLFVKDGSEISLGYPPLQAEGKVNKVEITQGLPVSSPAVNDKDHQQNLLQKKALLPEKNEILSVDPEVNSLFGFSEAEDFDEIKMNKNEKQNWDKFGFLFCQSSDSDEFSVKNQTSEFHCDFNPRPNVTVSGYEYGHGTDLNTSGVAQAVREEEFCGWLDRPSDYGVMSLNFGDSRDGSPCLGLDHGGFESTMEFM